MAVKTMWLSGGFHGGETAGDYLSEDMSRFATDWWPPYAAEQPPAWIVAVESRLPVDANGSAIEMHVAHSWSDDYYHRVHLIPGQLTLGNVVNTQVAPVRVWNAWLEPQLLTEITPDNAEGVTTGNQPEPPFVINALEERTWDVAVTPDGPPAIDARLTWLFAGVPSPTLHITGSRIVAFAWAPDWRGGVQENLAWLTDVLTSTTGREQRRALRLAPRQTLTAELVLAGIERQQYELAAFGWSGRIWALPIWPQQQWLQAPLATGATSIPCDTRRRGLTPGSLALLRGETALQNETVEILDVADTHITLLRPTQQPWPVGTRLYPLRQAQLIEQPQAQRLTDRAGRVPVSFAMREPIDWPAAFPADSYRGQPVFALRPDETENLTHGYQRIQQLLDNSTGIPRQFDTAQQAFTVHAHRWVLHGRTEQAAFRGLLYALRGRQKVVWVPTHADDLSIVAAASSSGSTLDVAWVGYTRYAQNQAARRDIRIELVGGAVLHRRITGSSELSAAVERLALDSVLGVGLTPASVARISFMALCRLDSDSVDIQHETDSDGVAISTAVFRSVFDEL